MWTITLLAFLLITFLVGYTKSEEFADVLPLTYGGLLLSMYILGFISHFSFLAVLAVCFLIIIFISIILMGKEGRLCFAKEMASFYINANALVIICGLVVIGILTAGHVATWWDDINFWATDAKALYHLDSFAGKYGNAAPEFGDYPPIIQLAKLCILRINPYEFREGLGFSGYYIMNVIFALPVFKAFTGKKNRNPVFSIIGIVLAFLLPGVCNDVWSHGACADVTMGIVYGALLISIFDRVGHQASFYYGRIAVYLGVLALTKSVGFEWALYAVILLVVIEVTNKKDYKEKFGSRNALYALVSVLTGASFQIIWWVNCLVNRRIAKLTSSGVHMAAGGYSLPDNAVKKAGLFLEGFAVCPMHTDKTWAIDLSSLTMLVIIVLAIVALSAGGKITKCERKTLLIFSLVTALIAYGIIFVGHVTIFAGETQYDSAEVMAISISRYAAPFTIGMLMLLIYIVCERVPAKISMLVVALFILLTTDYLAAKTALFDYRASLDLDMTARDDMLDEAGKVYIGNVGKEESLWGHRVLFFRDDTVVHWVKDTYINYEVAPVATVYSGFNPQTMNDGDLAAKINELHAEYIYMERLDEKEGADSICDLLAPLMEEGKSFEYETVYHVEYMDGKLVLKQ